MNNHETQPGFIAFTEDSKAGELMNQFSNRKITYMEMVAALCKLEEFVPLTDKSLKDKLKEAQNTPNTTIFFSDIDKLES